MIPQRCRPWIEAALREGEGGYTMEAVEAALADGRQSLVEFEKAAVVLEILHFGERKVLNVFALGGERGALGDLPKYEPWLNAVAKGVGASLRLEGRRGWARVMRRHGWRQQTVILTKEPG